LGGKPSPFSSLGTSAFHVAVDDTGRAYVHGDNSAPEFPVTPNAIKASSAGNDSFLTKFSPNGSNVEYSTLIAQNEYGSGGLALDDRGAAYVSGATSFADVPTTPGAFAPTPPSGENAYV